MKKILQTLSQKWAEYLMEILVLIIGIYSAFALKNWNEDRKAQSLERDFINGVIMEMEADSIKLSHMKRTCDLKVKQTRNIIAMLSGEVPLDTNRMIFEVFTAGSILIFRPQMPSNQELISVGNLSLISNKKIKSELRKFNEHFIFYHDFMYSESIDRSRRYNAHIHRYFSAEIMNAIWVSGRENEGEPDINAINYNEFGVDIEGFMSDKEMEMLVKIIADTNAELNDRYFKDLNNMSRIYRS